jgi:hypothetical protein
VAVAGADGSPTSAGDIVAIVYGRGARVGPLAAALAAVPGVD